MIFTTDFDFVSKINSEELFSVLFIFWLLSDSDTIFKSVSDAPKWRQILSATFIKRLFLLPGRMAIKTFEKLRIVAGSSERRPYSHQYYSPS